MRWDKWRGSLSGDVVMRVKHLLHCRGFKLDLHKMVRADAAECFHTHPAKSLRMILWGGYIDQQEDGSYGWRESGYIGLVRPETSHRVAMILNGRCSYSLWLRWPKTHAIELRGDGWPAREVNEG